MSVSLLWWCFNLIVVVVLREVISIGISGVLGRLCHFCRCSTSSKSNVCLYVLLKFKGSLWLLCFIVFSFFIRMGASLLLFVRSETPSPFVVMIIRGIRGGR